MNGLQIFAFIVLPIAVSAGGWIIALAVNPPPRLKAFMTKVRKPHRRRA